MKKIISILTVILIMALSLCSCSENTTSSEGKTEIPPTPVEQTVTTIEGEDAYEVTLEISQTHFTLDLSTHLKDAVNTCELPILVDKRFYDSCEIGDVISNDFRIGSFLFKGSIGDWKITVSNKQVIPGTEGGSNEL